MTYQECNRAIRAAELEAERHRRAAAGRETEIGGRCEELIAEYWEREAGRLASVRRSYGRTRQRGRRP